MLEAARHITSNSQKTSVCSGTRLPSPFCSLEWHCPHLSLQARRLKHGRDLSTWQLCEEAAVGPSLSSHPAQPYGYNFP
ncbi:rCG46745 [Rattus norvegicus]|uniref:RCG46745 n=1 Tax=Rattus norvegicus TaxID=10116 RepID=A6IXE6_RAT|nr:rCG46745 [Rattus norvegicus]